MKRFSALRGMLALLAAAWLSVASHDCLLHGITLAEVDAAHHHSPGTANQPHGSDGAESGSVAVAT